MKERIGVFMQLFRKEPSMYRSIDSVLSQTYKNVRLYILVSKETQADVLDYVKESPCVIVIEGKPGDKFTNISKKMAEENDYIATIDADDWYDETYLEVLYRFAGQHRLDLAATGCRFIKNGVQCDERSHEDLIWSAEKTGQVLPQVYSFFRTVWGKLIAASVIKKAEFHRMPDSLLYGGYGGDTMITFLMLEAGERIGVCHGTPYNYQISEGSHSYLLKPGRLEADELVYQFTADSLRRMGDIVPGTYEFLHKIYANALIDTMLLINKKQEDEAQRIQSLLYILKKEHAAITIGLAKRGELGRYSEWQQSEYLDCYFELAFPEVKNDRDEALLPLALELLEVLFPEYKGILSREELSLLLYSKELLSFFVFRRFSLLQKTLSKMLKFLSGTEREVCLRLMRRLTKNSLLQQALSELKENPEAKENLLGFLIDESYEEAFEECSRYFEGDYEPEEGEWFVRRWLDLAVKLENSGMFVLGKELLTEVLARQNRMEEAKRELNELSELGICDENTRALAQVLGIGQNMNDEGRG